MHSMERHNTPFAISEDYDWIAVPGHIGWVAATAIIDSHEDEILQDWSGDALRASWKRGWVRMEMNPYITGEDVPWWTECSSKDKDAEPAMIWQNLS